MLDASAWSAELAAIKATLEPQPDYREHPEKWLDKILGEYAWGLQREVWRSVVANRATAVHSCHDSGKSFIASRIVAWWLSTHPVGEAFIVTTAPTSAQVNAILWREIGKAHRKARERGHPMPGRIVGSPFAQWKINDELVGYGRKPADYEQSAFNGIHARYVLIVLDEAGGIVRSLWDAVDSLATNEEARILAIGNPDDPAAHFATVCKPGSDWNVIRIDGLRTPNFNAEQLDSGLYPLTRALMAHEGIPLNTEEVPRGIRPLLLSPMWVEERIRRWCGVLKGAEATLTELELRDLVARRTSASPLFTAKVRGDFPDGGTIGVIPLGWVNRAVERWKDWDTAGRPTLPGIRIAGVDVATTGEDETCIARRQGDAVEKVTRYPHTEDTTEIVDLVAAELDGHPGSLAIVDVIGVGQGVRDMLRRLDRNAVGFNASRQSDRTDRAGEFRFRNDRAAAWWRLRQALDPAYGSTLMLPDDEQLIQELTAPTWRYQTGKGMGVIQVELKDEIKKRLGHSTDSADAVIHAFWVDGSPMDGTSGANEDAIPWHDRKDEGVIPYDREAEQDAFDVFGTDYERLGTDGVY